MRPTPRPVSAVVCRCILVLVYWYQVTAGVYYHAWIDLKSTIRIMAVATVPLTALEPSGVLVFWVRHHDVVAPAWFEFAIGYYVVVTRHQAWARDVTLLSEARASRPRGYFLPVRCPYVHCALADCQQQLRHRTCLPPPPGRRA